MAVKDPSRSALVIGMLVLTLAGICIGYDLAKLVNGLDGAGPLFGGGSVLAALAAINFSRVKFGAE